jgi:hypothetical protein
MKRSHLSLLVVSTVLLGGSVPRSPAQDDKPATEESGLRSFKDRGDLLAKTLIFSKEFTRVTDLRTKEGLPDYPAAINKHFGKGVSPDKNGAVALYEAFGPAPEGGRLSDQFFELLGMPVPPADGKYFQHFGVGLPVEKRRSLNDRYSSKEPCGRSIIRRSFRRWTPTETLAGSSAHFCRAFSRAGRLRGTWFHEQC